MDIGGITAVIVAATGLIGAITAYLLGKRGQRNDERQQSAKTRLEERIASFDEMESLNDRLAVENTRLRELLAEAEARGDLRLARQARQCSERLEEIMTSLSALSTVVMSEVLKASTDEAIERARQHIADHPDVGDES